MIVLGDFSSISPTCSSLEAWNPGYNTNVVLLFGQRTRYLVDLQDFSPLLGGGAALSSRAILVFRAVVLHKGDQLLGRDTKKTKRI